MSISFAGFCKSDACRSRCWAPIGSTLLNQLAASRVSTFNGLICWLRLHDGPVDLHREYWAGRTRRAAAEELWQAYQHWRVLERVQWGMMPHPPARRKLVVERKTYAPFEVIEGGRRPRWRVPPL
jgi:hypothetical protein